MCHFRPLPGDPDYNQDKGMDYVIEAAKKDLINLQAGGVDAVMFSNEFSLPYLTKVENITPIAMAAVISELKREITVPFGVNVLWDPAATIELATAVDAVFVREIFSGVYASDFGLWNTNIGEVAREKVRIGGNGIKQIYNILPEAAGYLGDRSLTDIARSTIFNCRPDSICISGITAGVETSLDALRELKSTIKEVPVMANTGVNIGNIKETMKVADGAIVGTYFKRDGYTWNEIDENRVKELMAAAKAAR